MTAATKTRHLAAVPDHAPTGTPARIVETLDLPDRRAELATEHDNACIAALAPEVVEQQRAAIAKAMRAAAKENADLRAILLDLTRSMFVTGYMNGAADQQQAGHTALAQDTLAEIIRLESVQRRELRETERVLRVVKP
jgi:hypothetical protein